MLESAFMKSFENRLALGEVLDDVHRYTLAEALGGVGINLARNSWSEIEAAVSKEWPPLPQDTFLSILEYYNDDAYAYGGDTSIGELFGEEYVLTTSGRTPFFSENDSSRAGLGDDTYRRRIELFTPSSDTCPDFTSIYLLRDMPPMAVHADALIELDLLEREEVPSDTWIIEWAQKKYGPERVQYISEAMAARIIHALQTDRKRLYNTNLFFNGEIRATD
jgi:hypothetical protein